MARKARKVDPTEDQKKKPSSSKEKKTAAKKKASPVVSPTPEHYLRALRDQDDSDGETEAFAFYADELSVAAPVREWISTGSLALDRLIGGGWPVGRITELAAWENVGKSTLLDQSIAMAQRGGAITALIETEKARDIVYSRRLGIDPEKLITAQAETLEEAYSKMEQILGVHEATAKALRAAKREVPPLLIAWDSLGGTPAQAELDGESDDKHVGVAARINRMNFRRLVQRISDLRCALVFTNHFYQQINGTGNLVTYGGGGIRYFTSLRVWLTRTGHLKVGEDVVGQTVEAKIRKTRVAAPKPPAELALIFGAGFDNAWTLFDWLRSKKRIEQRGAYSYFTKPNGEVATIHRSFLGFGQLLADDPELYRSLVEEYRSGT